MARCVCVNCCISFARIHSIRTESPGRVPTTCIPHTARSLPAVAAALEKEYHRLLDADIVAIVNARLEYARMVHETPEEVLTFEYDPQVNQDLGQEEIGMTAYRFSLCLSPALSRSLL